MLSSGAFASSCHAYQGCLFCDTFPCLCYVLDLWANEVGVYHAVIFLASAFDVILDCSPCLYSYLPLLFSPFILTCLCTEGESYVLIAYVQVPAVLVAKTLSAYFASIFAE